MATSFELVLQAVGLVNGSEVDIGVEKGCIAMLAAPHSLSGIKVVPSEGLTAIPGVIDSQVHFREPGLTHKEDLESGTRAAVMGGVTSIMDEPNTEPTTTTAEALSAKLALASGRCWCHYGFWVGAASDNIDQLGTLEAMPHVAGIGEVFMASSTGPLLIPDDASLLQVLRNTRHRVAIHAEDEPRIVARRALLPLGGGPSYHPEVRDAESSRLATERVLRLSAESQRPVHILHVSTLDELPLLARAKAQGLGTTCEVTPQHLSFTDADYAQLGSRIQMNTPIRSQAHQDALWAAVREGLFDVFGSDHAPHTAEEKARPYPESPSGMPGVQTMLPVLLDFVAQGRLGLDQMVAMTSTNPARLFRLPQKGKIDLGFDADLTIVDLKGQTSVSGDWLQSKCGWSPYEGRALEGRVVHTVVSGEFAVRDGCLLEPGLGQPLDFAEYSR